jgi:hypothetical protein
MMPSVMKTVAATSPAPTTRPFLADPCAVQRCDRAECGHDEARDGEWFVSGKSHRSGRRDGRPGGCRL